MDESRVTVFAPYDFQAGQKIRIDSGPRFGDWEVVGVDDKRVTLRCPLSGKEATWARFCYLVEELERAPWPRGEGNEKE